MSLPSTFFSGFRTSVFCMVMALLLFSGCESEPEDLIPEETYIDLLVEFELIIAAYSKTQDTDLVLMATERVMTEYGITEEQFLRSHDFYQQDVEKQVTRHRTAVERISQIHGELANELRALNSKAEDSGKN